MASKNYIIAVKSDHPGGDWLKKISSVEGVQLEGGTSDQVRVKADPAAMQKVRQLLDDNFIIEEEMLRTP